MAETQQQSQGKKPKAPQGAPKGGKDGAPKSGEPKAKKPRERSDYVARLKTHYEQVIRGELSNKFGYTNRMQIPAITKIVLNMGIGEGVADRKKVENAANDLSLIAGQKAVITKSRKSIATYKLRDGQPIGCKVTLRKSRMYDFLDRLVNIIAKGAGKDKRPTTVGSVIITGHTDRVETGQGKDGLAEERAKAVRDYLVSKGVDSKLMFWEGKGSKEPVPVTKFCEG